MKSLNAWFTRYGKGKYGFKNGIAILNTAPREWIVYACCGDVIEKFETLKAAKLYLWHRYCR